MPLQSPFLRGCFYFIVFRLNSCSCNRNLNNLYFLDLSTISSVWFSWFFIFMIGKYTLFRSNQSAELSRWIPPLILPKYSCRQSPGQEPLNHQIEGWVLMCFPGSHLNYMETLFGFIAVSVLPNSLRANWALMPSQNLNSAWHPLAGPWLLN